jgi:signal transduction histidine kinase
MELLRGICSGVWAAEGPSAGSSESVRAAKHAWERWVWAWHAAFYALLVLSVVSSLADLGPYGRPQAAIVSLSVFFGFWYWLNFVRSGWLRGTRPALIYVAVALVLWLVLAALHPAYHVLLFVLYAQIYGVLPMRWAIFCSVVLTGLIVARGLIQEPGSAFAWILPGVLSITFGSLFGLWIDSIIRQSADRQRLIEELEATRQELAGEERRAGTLEERGRLAREIHDTLAQGFISIVTHLEAAEEELPPGTETLERHLDRAKRAARDNLVEARRLVAALRPEILEGSSLPEALRRLAERWSEDTAVRAEVSVTGEERRLPQEIQVTVLRIAQEALSNIGKHARASRVTVTLSHMEDLVALDVQDDGDGFDPQRSPDGRDGGFGLLAMRERVGRTGGTLLIESGPGEGTTLAVQLPLEAEQNATGSPESK